MGSVLFHGSHREHNGALLRHGFANLGPGEFFVSVFSRHREVPAWGIICRIRVTMVCSWQLGVSVPRAAVRARLDAAEGVSRILLRAAAGVAALALGVCPPVAAAPPDIQW